MFTEGCAQTDITVKYSEKGLNPVTSTEFYAASRGRPLSADYEPEEDDVQQPLVPKKVIFDNKKVRISDYS